MLKKRVLIILVLFITVLSGHVYAQETALLNYSDGTMREVLLTKVLPLDLEPDENVAAPTVTLDAWVSIEDYNTGESIRLVYPGQQVILWIFFDSLGSLEVPFADLVGRRMVPFYFLRGKLNYSEYWTLEIEPGDENLVGLGMSYTVPKDAQTGYFIDIGLVFISGIDCQDNSDSIAGLVYKVPVAE